MNKPLVSIVVPVYNVEGYLKKCVESLTSQTYPTIEILLIDDGSKDESPALCDQLALADSRIKVLHKTNGGLSDARNAGIDMSCGEFITFTDSDDYLEPESIELLVNAALTKGSKLAHMHSYIVDGGYNIVENQSDNTRSVVLLSSAEYLRGICNKTMSESVCDKLFHRSFFDNGRHRFQKGRLNEDFLFLSELLFEDCMIADVDFSGYNYYRRPGSISHSGYGKSISDSVSNAYDLMIRAKAEKPEIVTDFARMILFQCRTLFIIIPWSLVTGNSEEYLKPLACMREALPLIDDTNLPKADKIFLKCVNLCPKLTIKIVQILFNLKSKNSMSIIAKILNRLMRQPAPSDEEISCYIADKIRNGGGKVGSNFDLIASSIDMGEPYLIEIGDDVTITGVKVLTHDASLKKSIGYTKVGRVSIGNNVFIGWGSVVLMNTTIGDNVVIGAGSVVSGNIPNNSVVVGNPWHVICSFEEYKQKILHKMEQVPKIDKTPDEILKSIDDIEILMKSGYGFIK